LPLPNDGTPLESNLREYLAETPGLEVWTGSGWAVFSGRNAAALYFADDNPSNNSNGPDVGELSVRTSKTKGSG